MLELAREHDLGKVRQELAWQKLGEATFHWDSPLKLTARKSSTRKTSNKPIREALASAQEEIVLQTPYLVYRRGSPKDMKELRKTNPNLRFLLSSNSLAAADHIHVYAISFKHRQKFYRKLGLDIYEFMPYPEDRYVLAPGLPQDARPRMIIHAKTWVVDSKTIMIGSHNFDPRSTLFNTECGIIIDDEAFASSIREQILRDMSTANSWTVGKRKEVEILGDRIGRFIGDISGMIPFFDVLPYRYTSNFKLIEGKDPLPSSRHPDFHQHYEDVGQFPGAPGAGAIIKTRLMEIFGGWSRPFM